MPSFVSWLLLHLSITSVVYCNINIYVSNDGNDQSGDGTVSNTFATVHHALHIISKIYETTNTMDLTTINLKIESSGFYYIPAAIELNEYNIKSTATAPFIISNYNKYDNNLPVISGGIILKNGNWKLINQSLNLWSLNVTNQIPNNYNFNQLFLNGMRCIRARTPNYGLYYHMKSQLSPPNQNNGFVYNTNELSNQFIQDLQNVLSNKGSNQIELIIFDSWLNSRRLLTKINEINHSFLLNNQCRIEINPYSNSGSRYYFENSFHFIDGINEWYLDTINKILYYIPEDININPNSDNMTFVVPTYYGDLFVLNGTEYIEIINISFGYIDWNRNQALMESGSVQAASFLNTSGVHIYNSQNILLDSISVKHIGDHGIWIDSNSNNITIQSSLITDIGAGGIRIGRGKPLTILPNNQRSSHNLIINNVFCNGGMVFAAGNGILLQLSSFNTISHNEVCFFNHVGISVGWTWNYEPTEDCANHNIIEWNEVHHLGNGILSDLAGIYFLGNSTGTICINNLIHDIYPYYTYGHGIYLDQASTSIVVNNNIVHSTEAAAMYQHFGLYNNVSNNIFTFSNGGNFGMLWQANLQYKQFGASSLYFSNNIIIFDNNTQYVFESPYNGTWIADYNLYWNYTKINENEMISNTFPNLNNSNILTPNLSFVEWQKMTGNDINSVIKDPLFVDPFHFNFSLEANSPVYNDIYFKDINNLNGVGIDANNFIFNQSEWTTECNIDVTNCVEPPSLPADGSYISGILHYECGSVIVYHCVEGYILEGPVSRKCLANGQWTDANIVSKCVKN